jgi:copper chaperone CopZ
MSAVAFEVHGMTCGGCENSVQRAIGQVPGVEDVRADHQAGLVEVRFTSEPDDEAVRTAVGDAGYDFVGRRGA